ncbi:hypothetical protein T11_847 [Trichinella zimbabwensis]|uniref:Uncharacterized protein n=1 Tax=Trichinella zimbabwensis TaxID=268475 RepID=A0A0V1DLL9_9BILA|nr:hypothetical protein T11_14990 [Trichinella zimbabwensis]KRY62463.1 hypothetical protein T11_847 [Trichinella zimbabwensis]
MHSKWFLALHYAMERSLSLLWHFGTTEARI